MVYICKLSKELQDQAEKELHEVPSRRDQDIEHIRKWIQKQPHLNIRTDDYFILRFLRGCKFSLERTKEKIDMHFTLKTLIPEWFLGRDPEDAKLREILKLGVLLPLKETDDLGRRVFFCRQGVYKPENYHVNDITKTMYMLMDTFFEDDEIHQIAGIVMIMDMKGMTAGHMLHYPPTVMKKSMVMWQDGYAMRNKCLHYINFPSAFETLFNIAKSFMKEKLVKRIKIHGSNFEGMYNDVPKRIMPKEYGGEAGTLQELTDYWVNILDSKRKWILEDQKNRVDESKRPGKPKNSEVLFGLDGSFRKLNVD